MALSSSTNGTASAMALSSSSSSSLSLSPSPLRVSAASSDGGHIAFRSVAVLSSTSYDVLCLCVWGERVLVGCSDECVRVFARSPSSLPEHEQATAADDDEEEEPHEFQQVLILRSLLLKGRRPLRLCVLEALHVLVCIDSGGECFSYDLSSFTLVNRLETGSSRCLEMCTNESQTHPHLLSIASRSKLLLFQWKGEQLGFVHLRTFSAPSRLTNVAFVQPTKLCVASAQGLHVLNMSNGKSEQVFSDASLEKPRSTLSMSLRASSPSPHSSCILLSSERAFFACGHTVFQVQSPSSAASCRCRSRLPLADKASGQILSLAYCSPYILALTQDGKLLAINAETLQSAAPLEVPGASLLSYAADTSLVFVASSKAVWFIEAVSIDEQIEALLHQQKFNAALALCQSSIVDNELRVATMAAVHRHYGHYLLHNEKRYEAAMACFQQSNADPREVLGLFSRLIDKAENNDVADADGDDVCEEAISALIPYINRVRSRLHEGLLPDAFDAEQKHDGQPQQQEMSLESLADTMLLAAYAHLHPDLVIPFLSRRNACHTSTVERMLSQRLMWKELLFVLQNHGLHEKALQKLGELSTCSTAPAEYRGTAASRRYINNLMRVERFDASMSEREENEQRQEIWKIVSGAAGSLLETNDSAVLDMFAGQTLVSTPVVQELLRERAPVLLQIAFIEGVLLKDDTSSHRSLHNELVLLYLDVLAADADAESSLDIQMRLRHFLQSSTSYNSTKLLAAFPTDRLHFERAILLYRDHRSAEALELLVAKVGIRDAIRFCDDRCLEEGKTSEDSPSLHMRLFRLLLSHGGSGVNDAIQLLGTHSTRLDFIEALRLLPSDVALCDIQHAYEHLVCSNLERYRCHQLLKSLSKAENLQMEAAYYNAAAHSVRIDGSRACENCGQRFSECSTVIVRYPNGVVVDYKCSVDINAANERQFCESRALTSPRSRRVASISDRTDSA